MLKKIFLVIMVLLLTSCTVANDADIIADEPEIIVPDGDSEDLEGNKDEIRYTGEVITDGYFEDKGRIYFIPDKETRELLKNEYPIPIEAGESIPLDYEEAHIIEDFPEDLGIYKVEVEANFNTGSRSSVLKSIKLINEIGMVEYEGKVYPTNDLDETVTAKDRVLNLIVSNVMKYADGGVIIQFEGEIETEGFYNVHPGGEFFNFKNFGRIVPDEASIKNLPSYLGTYNNYSVYFMETNDLFQQLANHSAIGRGKFKSKGYNIGMGVAPIEELTEIISMDENYKGLFPYDDNSITGPLANEKTKYKAGFMDKYAIIYNTRDINDYRIENSPRNYYFLGYEDLSKIHLLTTDEFYYSIKENDEDSNRFELISESSAKNPHSIRFRYFDKNSSSNGKDTLWKTFNYGYFKNGDEIVRIFEGDSILGMIAENIYVEYLISQDSADGADELVRITCEFSGETTLTGKLTLYYDEGFGYNKLNFTADEEGIKKLPIHDDNLKEQGWITFEYESVKELLGTEPFEKNCEITINNYIIAKSSYTSSVDVADLINVNFLE